MNYINNNKTTITSFTIRKKIECINIDHANAQIESLKRLYDNKNTFGKILIPNFTFGQEQNVIWYIADYVKGQCLSTSEMVNIVWPSCVLREDTFTLSNYDRINYIRCDESKDIYYIDLNDCKDMSMQERHNVFAKQVKI